MRKTTVSPDCLAVMLEQILAWLEF